MRETNVLNFEKKKKFANACEKTFFFCGDERSSNPQKNGEKGSGNVRRGLDNVRECFSKKSEIWGLHNVRAEYEKPALNPPFRAFW